MLLALRGEHNDVNPVGVLLALCAGGCWAAYILLSKNVGPGTPHWTGWRSRSCVGTLLVIPAGVIEGGSALVRPAVLAGGLLVGLLSSLIPYSLEIVALRRLSASTFGLLMSLEPAVAALAGVIVLSQHLTGVLLVAVIMVVAASVGTTITGPGSVGSAGKEPQPSV